MVEFSDLEEIEKEISSEFVLDYDQFLNVIGVEIINLELQAGDPHRYSYDSDTDSFYLKLSSDRSFDQKAVYGKIILDKDGQIVSLRAKIG